MSQQENMMAARTYRSLDFTDSLPPDLRACVHEFGTAIVEVLMKHGVRNPDHIKEVVMEVWRGSRSFAQKSDTPEPLRCVEWLMNQSGCDLPVKTLWRVLYLGGYAIVPLCPTRAMLDASMAAVTGGKVVCTKEEKHRRCYSAAVKAHAAHVNGKIRASA